MPALIATTMILRPMAEDASRGPDVSVEFPGDGIGVVTLNRPRRLNALTGRMFVELAAAFREVGRTRSCGAVVLTGAGRSFSAGMDLVSGLADQDVADPLVGNYAAMRHAVDAVLTMREIPQPVIAAVRGHAVGAGFALTVACDIRVCAPDARFSAPFLALGVSAGDLGLTWMLPRIIGVGRAAELFYRGGELEARSAAAVDLVQHIATDPVAEAKSIARAIASRPPLGVQMTKELLDMSLRSSNLREHLELEMRSQVIGLSSVAHARAAAAFGERKRPSPIRDTEKGRP